MIYVGAKDCLTISFKLPFVWLQFDKYIRMVPESNQWELFIIMFFVCSGIGMRLKVSCLCFILFVSQHHENTIVLFRLATNKMAALQ